MYARSTSSNNPAYDSHTAIASRLAPTGDLRQPQNRRASQIKCGSEPARDDGGTSNIIAS
ncbi:hypothetical protein DZG01_13490 [Pseudomonas fluorescens]|nr:hypothetical protein DZG01_13490 [Pseudomonas fluorescens]